MKKQKKYVTRDMILGDIEKSNRKMERLRKEAAVQDDLANGYKLLGTAESREKFADIKEWAERLWKQAERIETTRLAKLKRTLAAFDTQPMFGDSQVVLQQK